MATFATTSGMITDRKAEHSDDDLPISVHLEEQDSPYIPLACLRSMKERQMEVEKKVCVCV